MDYVLVIHRAEEGGYWAEVPALAGCFAQAESVEDLLDEARAAIASHLEALREDGQPAPEDGGIIIATVRVRQPSAA
jgi:predicted RNase H-like HicB family nuclease